MRGAMRRFDATERSLKPHVHMRPHKTASQSASGAAGTLPALAGPAPAATARYFPLTCEGCFSKKS